MQKKLFVIALGAIFAAYANANGYFSHDVGQLHISGQKWEIQHVLNLTEYTETSTILNNCIDSLRNVCEQKDNPLCTYFQHATENINTAVQADTSKLDILSRKKRFLIFIPVILGVTVISLWAGFTVAKSAMNSVKDEIRDNLDLIERAGNLSIANLEIIERYIKDSDAHMLKLQEAINNNTQNIELQSRFFGIINVISFSAQLHEKMQIKLNDIYYNDVESRLFEIIDFSEFKATVAKINEKLKPNLMLPNITSMARNKFIKSYTEYNNTHLTVSVDLPVIRKSGYNVSEFVPIPLMENGKLYMLDLKTTSYFKNGSNIQLFPDDNTRNSLCKTQDKVTICNSLFEEFPTETPLCLNNLLQRNSDVNCIYNEIPFKNYFIKISNEILYIFLVDPSLRLVMDCRGKVYAITLTQNQILHIPKGCDIYKYTDKLDYVGEKITKIDISKDPIHSALNLNVTEINNKLSLLPLYDKYNLEFIEIKGKATRFGRDIPLQRVKINEMGEISVIPNFGIMDFFSNTITKFVIFAIIIIAALFLMKSLLIELFTDWKASRT